LSWSLTNEGYQAIKISDQEAALSGGGDILNEMGTVWERREKDGKKRRKKKEQKITLRPGPEMLGRSGVNADAEFAEGKQRKKEKAYTEFTPTGRGKRRRRVHKKRNQSKDAKTPFRRMAFPAKRKRAA